MIEQQNSDKVRHALVRRSTSSRWTEWGVIAGFWIMVALLTIVQEAFDPRFSGQEAWKSNEALFTFSKYMLWVVLTPVIFWLVRFFSQVKSGWELFLLHGVVGLGASAIVHYIYHMLWNVFVPEDPQSMSVLYVLSGLHFLPEFFLYLVVLAAGFARDYFLRYKERLRESAQLQAESASLRADAAELKAQLADARLQALSMQLNPHFLFNTLYTVTAYIERDPVGTRRMVTLLSELLRYSLEKTDVKEVTLGQELHFLDKYFEIQSIRFGDRLEVRQDIDPATLEALVPTLMLQPLVENAIKHGVSAVEGTGRIELRTWLEGDQLHVSLRDNGPGLTGYSGDGASAEHAGTGLQNTRKRLATLYRNEQRLTLENAPDGGAVARLTLPFHTHRDLYVSSVQV